MKIVTVHTKGITQEKANFILLKAEEVLSQTLTDREALRRKADVLLGLIGAVLAFSIGVLLDEGKLSGETLPLLFLGTQSILLFGLGIVTAATCLIPRSYAGPGNEPEHLLAEDFLKQDLPLMTAVYTQLLQGRISLNRTMNERAAAQMRAITFFAFASPAVSVFCALLIWLILR